MTDPESLANRVVDGEIRLHDLEQHTDHDTATSARRIFVERKTDTRLSTIGTYGFSAEEADANIENMIGAVQIPLGIAGPVRVNGAAASGDFYLPLATTEGALVASVNRGCALIRASGGATARIFDTKMIRAPVFKVAEVSAAERLLNWVAENIDRLAKAAESTTRHGVLLGIDPYVVGDNVFLRFRFDTKDAMGMNMVTIATEEACSIIEKETSAVLVSLSGNLCTDKKPAAINAICGRGRTVTADVVIPNELITDRLHASPEAIQSVHMRKNFVGSAKAGSLGFNAHVANVVAAMFLATGQDEAHVVEGANAITTVDTRPESLYVSVNLASLQVGTVGGGTTLPTQSEALDVLGLRGSGDPPGTNAAALAEIIAVGALAGELSLLGALASNHLSRAHQALGR